MGVVWTFFLSSIISLFFLPLSGETARYRLKYCLKGPLNPKQPTNQQNSPQVIMSQSVAAEVTLALSIPLLQCSDLSDTQLLVAPSIVYPLGDNHIRIVIEHLFVFSMW